MGRRPLSKPERVGEQYLRVLSKSESGVLNLSVCLVVKCCIVVRHGWCSAEESY